VRLLAAILESVTEIERIGDYAKGIGSITLKVDSDSFPPALYRLLVDMAERGRSMMRRSLDAFQQRDAQAACEIISDDDAVDDLFKEAFRAVLTLGRSDPLAIERANYLLWVAHNLERTADRVTNICESVVYMVSGELVSGQKLAVDEFLSSLSASRDRPSSATGEVPGKGTPDS
jgi:phosphate transport system protein